MDPQNGRSNPKRHLGWALVVLAASIFLPGKLLFDELREGAKREAQADVMAVGSLRASQIQELLEDRLADVKSLSDESFFSRAATQWIRSGAHDDDRRRQLVERLSAFLESHHFEAIVLYDSAGRVVLNVGSRIPDAQLMGGTASSSVKTGQLRFIDLHRHQDALLPVGMGFMSPLRDGSDSLGAFYLVEDPGQSLFPLIREWPNGNATAETHLVRLEGDRVVYLNQLRHRAEQALEFSLPLNTPRLAASMALRGRVGLLDDARDYRGKEVFSYAVTIRGTPWVLISKIDEEEAYRTVDRTQLLAAILAIAILAAVSGWFQHWQRRERKATDALLQKERERADVALKDAEKRCRTAFEQTALPMLHCAVQGDIIEVNDAWCDLFGYSREEIAAQHLTWQQVTHPEDLEHSLRQVKRLLSGEADDFKIEKRYIHKDGRMSWGEEQSSLLRNDHGEPELIISAIQDITERKHAEQQINFMAYHDKLTGLPNRALLFDRLSQAMSQAKRNGKHLALLFVDLDGFKSINDKYGHEAGDAVLRMAAQRFLACVRAVDTVSRLGGDEFAIVLGDLDDPQLAKGIADKIIQAFAQGMALPDGNECHVGTSIGISVYPEHGSAMDNLMTAADHAMYESKRNGKNTCTFFRAELPPGGDLQWIKLDNNYLLGVQDIDEQHRNLAYLVNRLNDALKHDEPSESIALMFDELLIATSHHFDTESRYMTNYHYPEQGKHEAEHAQLVKDVQRFKYEFNEGRELLVLQSIKDWLLGHIAYSDRGLAAYLKEHGVK